MKQLLILLFALSLTMLFAFSEAESNNTVPTANTIPQDTYVVDVEGVISGWVPEVDWFRYWVNVGNNIVITLFEWSPDLQMGVWDLSFPADPAPGTFLQFFPPGNTGQYIYSYQAQATGYHYLEISPTNEFAQYPLFYYFRIRNLDDPTLPVVMSGFNATQNGNFVGIQWITASETEMSGFNVYRGSSNNLQNAIRVNPTLIPATNTSTTQYYSYQDNEIVLGDNYYYWLEAVNTNSSSEYYGSVFVQTHPTGDGNENPGVYFTRLLPAYPNPSSGSVRLSFELSERMNAILQIYNTRGQLVSTICNADLEKGKHDHLWDGRDERGNPVANGVYLIRFQAGEASHSGRIVIAK